MKYGKILFIETNLKKEENVNIYNKFPVRNNKGN